MNRWKYRQQRRQQFWTTELLSTRSQLWLKPQLFRVCIHLPEDELLIKRVSDPDDGLNVDQTRQIESETWHSEQDTSQVSVSSLPEDEKSEHSTATVSSTTTTNTGENVASALVTTSVEDEPHFDAIVEQKGENLIDF